MLIEEVMLSGSSYIDMLYDAYAIHDAAIGAAGNAPTLDSIRQTIIEEGNEIPWMDDGMDYIDPDQREMTELVREELSE